MTSSEHVAPATMASSHLFTARVSLGKRHGPIPVVGGGKRIVEPFTTGSFHGPGFNATIEGGFAAPETFDEKILIDDQEQVAHVVIPHIYFYGTTDDGVPFYVEETGVGNRPSQNTRVVMNIGGKYANLQLKYIIATIKLVENRTKVEVECFDIPFLEKA